VDSRKASRRDRQRAGVQDRQLDVKRTGIYGKLMKNRREMGMEQAGRALREDRQMDVKRAGMHGHSGRTGGGGE
jgi:hypothetical protein